MKKTLSMLLAGAMLSGTIPMVSAAEPASLKELMGTVSGLSVPFETSVKVPADIEVRENGDTEYVDGPISIKQKKEEALPSFDYEATLYMGVVKETFDNYISKAEAVIESNGGSNKDALKAELENILVTGQFTVTIKNADEMIIPEAIKVDDKSLNGFNDKTELAFKEVSRKYEDNTMTIVIDVKDGMTKAELDTKLGENLTLSCEGVEIADFDEYELIGEITGWTNIGDDPATAEDESIAKIKYNAVQEGNESAKINAIVKVAEQSDAGTRPAGGGSSSSTIVIKTEVDGSQVDKKSSSKEITYNPYDLAVPEKEGHLFDGWVDKATGEEFDGNNKTFTKSTTIIAKWIPTGINVDFVIDGTPVAANAKKATSVTVPETAIVVGDEGTTITTTDFAAIVASDRKFEGWFLDAEYTIPAEASMTVTEDVTFYGKTKKLDGSDILDMDHHYAYIIGYPDGYVRPEQNISREEVATIFFRLLTEEARNSLLKKENNFTDVDSARWSNTAVSTMANYGTIVGYEDGSFRPEKAITRAEFVAMTARFYDLEEAEASFTDISGHWAEEYIQSAVAKGWINGYEDGTFKPDKNITRAEAMTIVNHLLNRKVDAEGLHADAVQWDDNTEDKWYYYEVLEATNTHNCEDRVEGVVVEKWTECLENFDWASIEL